MAKVMSNLDIIHELGKFPEFKGVFAADEKPDKLKDGEGVIFNLDDHDEPGSHWVCCIMHKGKKFYIDPLGEILDVPSFIHEYLGEDLIRNGIDFQPKRSVECGHYCCYFIGNFILFGKPFEQLTKGPSQENDK